MTLLRRAGALLALSAAVAGAQRSTPAPPPANAADVAFMQGMIAHHAQAVAMVGLLKTRTRRDDMQLLGERIDVSQRDEMATMRRWLTRHGKPVPDSTMLAHHAMDGTSHDVGHDVGHDMGHDMSNEAKHDMSAMPNDSLMPGMLTPAQMTALAQANGPTFDRLFLGGMIRHHQGAIAMVKRLFAQRGAAQDTEIYQFASDVDADQRAEITRMQALLRAMPAPDTPQ